MCLVTVKQVLIRRNVDFIETGGRSFSLFINLTHICELSTLNE